MSDATVIAAWLYAVFAAGTPPSEVEPPHERDARLQVIAYAIATESRNVDEAALVARTMWEESAHMRLDVHSGKRKGDDGKATCLAQIHSQHAVPRREWRELAGTDPGSTRRCVAASLKLYRIVAARCDRKHDGPLMRDARRATGYATGRRCDAAAWRGAMLRAHGAASWRALAPITLQGCSALLPCTVAIHDTTRIWIAS